MQFIFEIQHRSLYRMENSRKEIELSIYLCASTVFKGNLFVPFKRTTVSVFHIFAHI